MKIGVGAVIHIRTQYWKVITNYDTMMCFFFFNVLVPNVQLGSHGAIITLHLQELSRAEIITLPFLH
jgi:hypothetical protein